MIVRTKTDRSRGLIPKALPQSDGEGEGQDAVNVEEAED